MAASFDSFDTIDPTIDDSDLDSPPTEMHRISLNHDQPWPPIPSDAKIISIFEEGQEFLYVFEKKASLNEDNIERIIWEFKRPIFSEEPIILLEDRPNIKVELQIPERQKKKFNGQPELDVPQQIQIIH